MVEYVSMSPVDQIARHMTSRGLTVAVAESLTCGAIASTLGAGPEASDWLSGGVVAYQTPVKWKVLDVPEGPVVTGPAAVAMAEGVRELLGTDIGLAVTGVGGPGTQEGKPAGTVFVALVGAADAEGNGTRVKELSLDGEPDEILDATIEHALALLLEGLDSAAA